MATVGPLDVEVAELISEQADGGVDFPNYVKAPLQTISATQFERRGIEQNFCFNYGATCTSGNYRLRFDLVHGLR
jgi:hypothetical protein